MYEDPEEATLRAVDICIEQGVLVDILRKHKAEVISMVLSSLIRKHMKRICMRQDIKKGNGESILFMRNYSKSSEWTI